MVSSGRLFRFLLLCQQFTCNLDMSKVTIFYWGGKCETVQLGEGVKGYIPVKGNGYFRIFSEILSIEWIIGWTDHWCHVAWRHLKFRLHLPFLSKNLAWKVLNDYCFSFLLLWHKTLQIMSSVCFASLHWKVMSQLKVSMVNVNMASWLSPEWLLLTRNL